MAPSNYLLPELKPAQIDMTQALFKGMAAPMQTMAIENKNALAHQQLQDYQERKNALAQYGQTGDINQLESVAPEAAYKIREAKIHQQKANMEAIKPGMDYLYVNKEALKDPNQYTAIRNNAVQMSPMLAAHLPETFDPSSTPQKIDAGASAYERMRKLEDPYRAASLGLREKEIANKKEFYQRKLDLSERRLVQRGAKEGRDIGKAPRFDQFIQDPEISKLSYPEQVRMFNLSISQGKEDAKPKKELDPLKQAKLADIETTTRLKKKLLGEDTTGKGVVYTSDHELTPAEAAEILKKHEK
jgi:hypothetical protein